jgi:SAM-dependent methyltransferase
MQLPDHWERIYTTRAPDDVSWFEHVPSMSLKLIAAVIKNEAESIIDIGGGASTLVDHLLDVDFRRVAVLDISEAGLAMSKRRLGDRARDVEWIVADITTVEDVGRFDIWHDRAVFHFLTDEQDRRHYVRLAEHTLGPGGKAIMATFAADGPERCSGLEVRRYDAAQLATQCGGGFELTGSEHHMHITPTGVHQRFVYATFTRASGGRSWTDHPYVPSSNVADISLIPHVRAFSQPQVLTA